MSQMIPLQQISSSPFQHRKHFDEEKLKELAASIRGEGLMEPIVSQPDYSYKMLNQLEFRIIGENLSIHIKPFSFNDR